jgi:hypothetical protein
MATYNYKKVQEMRSMLLEEIKQIFPNPTVDVYMLVEERLQTAIMAGLFDKDIKDEVPDKRIKDK